MSSNFWVGRRVWITGASSGIGRASALEISRRGALVALSGRNTTALQEIAALCPGSVVQAFDATDRQANHTAAKSAATLLGGLDTVLLNAGTCEYIDLPEFDASIFERVHSANFLSMVYGIEAALPILRKGNKPQLAGMSSTVAWLPLPRSEAYGSSKAAIQYMLDALRVQLRPEGVLVSGIYPGFVRTPLTERNNFPMPFSVTPQSAALHISNGLERGCTDIHFPKIFSWSVKLLALLPKPIWAKLATLAMRKK